MSVLRLTSGVNKIKLTTSVTPRLVLCASNVNSASSSVLWGNITGTLSNQTDLQNALNAKQNLLVNSAGLASAVSDETGTGVVVFSNSPTLTGTMGANEIQLDTTPSLSANSQGKIYWDATDKTLAVDLNSATTLQVGQEQHVRAVNKTGSQINDGQVVYISGAQGNRPTITLARADSYTTSYVIGVATENIANDAEGYVTVNGVVRGYNTSGFSDGDRLYLSASTAGQLTKTMPTSPNNIVVVATALNSTNNGSIYVHPQQPLSADTAFTSNTDLVAPTQKATKAYADTKQTASANLTSLSGLSYVSASFVKMTGANTFTLDTNTYLTSSNKLSDLSATTSAELSGVITDETGSGSLVFANTPTLVTPVLGVASGTSLALGGATLGTNALAVTGNYAQTGDATHTGLVTLNKADSGAQTDLLINPAAKASGILFDAQVGNSSKMNLTYNGILTIYNYQQIYRASSNDFLTALNLAPVSSASAGTTIRNSPTLELRGNAWNSTSSSSKNNTVSLLLKPTSGATTSGRLVVQNNTVDGSSNTTELMSINTAGEMMLGTSTATGGSTKLTVNGDQAITGTLASTGLVTLQKADSGGSTDLLINPSAKASGYLFDAQVNGVSKFSVNSSGSVNAASNIFMNYGGIGTAIQVGVGVNNPTVATAGTTVQNSPTVRLYGAAWNTTSSASKNNRIDLLVKPTSGATTSGDFVIQNNTLDGTANTTQLFKINMTTGTATVTGSVISASVTPIAGTTTVAPIVLTSGTNLTSPQSGAFEFDGTNLYFTI